MESFIEDSDSSVTSSKQKQNFKTPGNSGEEVNHPLLDQEYADDEFQELVRPSSGPIDTIQFHDYRDSRKSTRNTEEIRRIAIETSPILALAFFGEIFTGQLLSHMTRDQSWNSFTKIDELLILVPVLTNLKGNIEMTLSCRLSTAANMGQLTTTTKLRREIAVGNLALVQLQALVVAFVAALVAFTLSRIEAGREDSFSWKEIFTVVATSMASASLSGMILGSFMCALVLIAKLRGINPDNVATPIASMLGDLLTIFIMGLVSTVLVANENSILTVMTLIAAFGGIPIFIFITLQNSHVFRLLKNGWAPLFFAMGISTITGLLLDEFVTQFEGYAFLAIINCSLPGAIGAVYSSRLSTSLHLDKTISGGEYRRKSVSDDILSWVLAPATLLAIAMPIPILFVLIANISGWLQMEIGFVCVFVVGFVAQLLCSLSLAHILTNQLMKRGYDPDMYALPIHSACIDVSGQLILVAVFLCVKGFGGDITVGA